MAGKKRIDSTGKKFNKLLVIEEVKEGKEWFCKCICDCGTEKLIRKYLVTHNVVKSCGCSQYNKLIGRKIGKLQVLEEVPERTKRGRKKYLCKCDCGNIKVISSDCLSGENTKSCGCLLHQTKYDELIGKKFDKLTVIKEVEKSKYGQRQFLCKCDCGNEKVILGINLITNQSTSCGCNRGYVENTKINMLEMKNAYSNSKSGIRGVWQDKNGYWSAIITVSRKRIPFYGGPGEEGKRKCIEWRKQMVEKYHKPIIKRYKGGGGYDEQF